MYPYNIKRNYGETKKRYNASSFKVFASNSDGCEENEKIEPEEPVENTPDMGNNGGNNMGNGNDMDNNDTEDREEPDCSDVGRYILEMIKEAIRDERADGRFYDNIANMLTDENDKKIMHKLHHDENKHEKIFMEIFEMITGEKPDESQLEADDKPVSDDMTENFENSIFDEISAVEFYRKLYFVFLNQEIRDALFEILTDEQNHADVLNYMYSKYKNK